MHFNILTNNKFFDTVICRRKLLFLLTGAVFLNSFKVKDTIFSNQITEIIKNAGVIVIKDLKTNTIIACSNNNKANTKYQIGSIAKIITATALLEEKILSPNEFFTCNGQEIIGHKKYYCWKDGGHGSLKVDSAISESCNLFFKKVSQRIAPEDILKYYKKYNLTINENFQLHDNSLSLGLDEQIKFSPLEMLSLLDILTYKKSNISTETLKIIKNSLKLCGISGTGKLIHHKGFSAGIKTGTAPYRNQNYNQGWAIGYAPFDKPSISFCIHIDNGTGSSNAVPIAVKTLEICKKNHYI